MFINEYFPCIADMSVKGNIAPCNKVLYGLFNHLILNSEYFGG